MVTIKSVTRMHFGPNVNKAEKTTETYWCYNKCKQGPWKWKEEHPSSIERREQVGAYFSLLQKMNRICRFVMWGSITEGSEVNISESQTWQNAAVATMKPVCVRVLVEFELLFKRKYAVRSWWWPCVCEQVHWLTHSFQRLFSSICRLWRLAEHKKHCYLIIQQALFLHTSSIFNG